MTVGINGGAWGGGVSGLLSGLTLNSRFYRDGAIRALGGRVLLTHPFAKVGIGHPLDTMAYVMPEKIGNYAQFINLRLMALSGGIIGGIFGFATEAIFSLKKFHRGEISGSEYFQRLLLSGGLGATSGAVGGLASVGSVRLLGHFISPMFSTLGGRILFGLTPLSVGIGVGYGLGWLLDEAKESLFT